MVGTTRYITNKIYSNRLMAVVMTVIILAMGYFASTGNWIFDSAYQFWPELQGLAIFFFTWALALSVREIVIKSK